MWGFFRLKPVFVPTMAVAFFLSGFSRADFGFDDVEPPRVEHLLATARRVARQLTAIGHPNECPRASQERTACTKYTLNVMPTSHDPVIDKDNDVFEHGSDDPFSDVLSGGQPSRSGSCHLFWRVSSLDALLVKMRELRQRCAGCVKALNIDSHGAPGLVSGIFDVNDLVRRPSSDYDDVRELFGAGAIVRLLGCKIGKGARGGLFLSALGEDFLGKNGGEVRAFTELATDNPLAPRPQDVSFNFSPIARYRQNPGNGGGKLRYTQDIFSVL